MRPWESKKHWGLALEPGTQGTWLKVVSATMWMLESRPTHLKLVVALYIYLESGAETTDMQDDLQEGCQVGPGLGPTAISNFCFLHLQASM